MESSTPHSDQTISVRETEIRHTDTRQQYREKIARITLDSMVQFVGLLDAHGTVREINKVALDGVGIKLSDVEGKPFWTTFWWQVSPEVNQKLRDSIALAAKGEFVRWDAEIYGRANGKETIIIDASLCPVKDNDGKVVFICAEGRDITEKKAQERLIAQKNTELQGLLERVRELDEIKTQFFSNVSHELRTPLQLVIGPADRLSQNDANMTPQQRQDAARVIGRNARMLLKHVNDLLDIAKFEAGKLKIALQDANINAVVRFIASHFDVLAADRNITYRIDAKENVVSAIDTEKIQRAVMNLLSNAFKFVPNGGKVRMALDASSTAFTISIDDSGPGVKPELRKAIFERFRQGDGGSNREFGGTGLGLAIAKEFVEMHQGLLEVLDSDLGGARFKMTLPLRRLSPLQSPPMMPVNPLNKTVVEGAIEELRPAPAASASSSGMAAADPFSHFTTGKPTVLVVEDNPEMNRFIVECLSDLYNVVTAFNGQQGLEMALKTRPTLIVTDIMMPKVSGEEMIAELRKHPELAGPPILLLTAKADEDLKIRLLENGAQDFVAKPFSERDLLVRVRNLIELKKSQERNWTLFNAMDEGFCTVEMIFDEDDRPLDYRFLEVNAAFEGKTGLKDARGKRMRELSPSHEQLWFEIYGKVALTGEPARFEDRAEALGRWFQVYAFRVGRPEDRQVAIFFNDISERKRIQTALEDADRRKDEFIAMLAHELRNPLAPIRNGVHILQKIGTTDERVEKIRGTIERQAAHMSNIVDDLLDTSRIARGKLLLKKETLDMARLVRETCSDYQADAQQRNISFDVRIHDTGLNVHGDRTRVAQCLGNLLHNAIKFSTSGSTITIELTRDGGNAAMRVSDTGLGIAPDVLPTLFEPFVQATQSLDRSRGGLGLGLALVRDLVKLHDGKVTASSDGAGKGSQFTIYLPLVAPAEEKHREASTSAPSVQRVLVIEDSDDAAESLMLMLELDGHEVKVARSGEAALKVVESWTPGIVLCDIGLPGMDGYAVCRELRKRPELKTAKMLALTGYGQNEDIRRAVDAGFNLHLTKPVDPEKLMEVIGRPERAETK